MESSTRVCQACGFDNPPAMRFCGGCGAQLMLACPACGFDNPPAFKFCGGCGAALEAPAPDARAPAPAADEEPDAERRELTVLFCDLVGSTELSEALDPEELRELILGYQKVCGEVIERGRGHIAQYLGDGLLVYFGFPRAHEDDPQRAIQAGLEMVEEVEKLGRERWQAQGIELAVRVGIHTGEVVAGEVGSGEARERLALGPTPNIAARLQGLAEARAVVISSTTHRQARGFFAFEPLGRHELKGVKEPIEVFRALRARRIRSRFEAVAERGLTPAVGRTPEIDQIVGRFAEVREGRGQVVVLRGEAGIGKSRLADLVRERVATECGEWLVCGASAQYQNTYLQPFRTLIEGICELEPADPAPRQLRALEGTLEQRGLEVDDQLPLLANLLQLPLEEPVPLPVVNPQKIKEMTLERLGSFLLATGNGRPVGLLVEDLHWLDPTSQDLLALLIERARSSPAFLLVTSRPGVESPWDGRRHVTALDLEKLAAGQAAEMVAKVTGGCSLPDEMLAQIVEMTDGVPLFIEELTRTVLDSGALIEVDGRYELAPEARARSGRLAIPNNLKSSLLARLDLLGESKRTAQLGAVLGREFSFDLLSAVSTLDKATLLANLDRLARSEMVFPTAGPLGTYVFKHALVQEAAYGSLLKSQRRRLHALAAGVLEERFPQLAEAEPELLAQHHSLGNQGEAAVPYWEKAGQNAMAGFALVEASRHFQNALDHLLELAESPDRDRRELELRSSLGTAQIAAKGYAATEVEETFRRARVLAHELGDPPPSLLWGIWTFELVRGNREGTARVVEQLESLEGGPARQLLAAMAPGMRAFFTGGFDEARRQFEAATAVWASAREELLAQGLGDAGLMSTLYDALASWYLGEPDTAWSKARVPLADAERSGDPFALSFTLVFAMAVAYLRRDRAQTRELAQRCIDISLEQGFAHWLPQGKAGLGWSEAEAGGTAAIAEIEQGLRMYMATGARLPLTFWITYLLDALRINGQADRGLGWSQQALEMSASQLDSYYEGELLRFKGEFLLMRDPDSDEPEALYGQALDWARERNARSFELRAATSLGRLLEARGRGVEGRSTLEHALAGIQEGADTRDVQEARELLAELG